MSKTLNLYYHGIVCIIWRYIKVFLKCFYRKSVCPVIWWSQPDPWKQWFCAKIFKETLKGKSLLPYDISVYLFLCLHLFNILVHVFSILLFLCNVIFIFCCLCYMPGVYLKSAVSCLHCVYHLLFSKTRYIGQYLACGFCGWMIFLWFAYLSLNVCK